MKEQLLQFAGYRKCGAFDVPDDRDWIYDKNVGAIIKELHKGSLGTGDLPIYKKSQGTNPSCTAYGLTACVEIEVVKTFHYLPDISSEDQWKRQKESAKSNLDDGDKLQNALSVGRKNGFYDKVKKVWYDIEYYRVMKEDMKKVMTEDNATIYTGSLISYKMVDKNYFHTKETTAGGHAWCSYDWGYGLNSWGNWGYKNTGVFYYDEENFPQLFTAYAVLVKPRTV